MDSSTAQGWWIATSASMGRGGHLAAFLAAMFLAAVYLSGGTLTQNPAKLLLLAAVGGGILDGLLCWACGRKFLDG